MWFRGSVDALNPDNLAAHASSAPNDEESPCATSFCDPFGAGCMFQGRSFTPLSEFRWSVNVTRLHSYNYSRIRHAAFNFPVF